MVVQKFYEIIGENYEDILKRLSSDAIIKNILEKFKDDDTFIKLNEAIINKKYDDAFIYSHTLKGISSNLGFTKLYTFTTILTEKLRNKDFDIDLIYETVKTEYYKIKEQLDKTYFK